MPITHPFSAAAIYHLRTTDSTMVVAQRAAEQGAAEGTAIITDFQRRGRGRLVGRVWRARRGSSLLCTVLLRRPEMTLATLPLRCGLALVNMLEERYGVRCHIKWPNDIVIAERKLAGILCSAYTGDENGEGYQLVGFGLNCRQRRFSAALRSSATSLRRAAAISVRPIELLQPLLASLKEEFGRSGWDTRLQGYIWRLHERVRFAPAAGTIVEGRLHGVALDGALRIKLDNGAYSEFHAGELLA